MEEKERKKVLLLEDSDIFCELVLDLRSIYSSDVDIAIAKNIKEAIKLFNDQSFDAILCDYNLKGGEKGTEFLEYVKRIDNTIPFAIITEDDRREVVVECLNKGADYFFEKSVFLSNPEKNAKSLYDVLELRRQLASKEKERSKTIVDVTDHDVTNSLTIIIATVELIKDSDTLEDAKALTDHIASGARAIAGAMKFSKDCLSMGKNQTQWNSIYRIIEKIKNQLLSEVTVINSIPQKLEVFCDPLIEKAFYNLLENAIHHGKATSIECTFKQEGESIIIFVKDNGSGISTSQKKTIFKKGFGKHTGYGLYFCREFFNSSEMEIEEIGDENGACFVVTIPEAKCRAKSEFNT